MIMSRQAPLGNHPIFATSKVPDNISGLDVEGPNLKSDASSKLVK